MQAIMSYCCDDSFRACGFLRVDIYEKNWPHSRSRATCFALTLLSPLTSLKERVIAWRFSFLIGRYGRPVPLFSIFSGSGGRCRTALSAAQHADRFHRAEYIIFRALSHGRHGHRAAARLILRPTYASPYYCHRRLVICCAPFRFSMLDFESS